VVAPLNKSIGGGDAREIDANVSRSWLKRAPLIDERYLATSTFITRVGHLVSAAERSAVSGGTRIRAWFKPPSRGGKMAMAAALGGGDGPKVGRKKARQEGGCHFCGDSRKRDQERY